MCVANGIWKVVNVSSFANDVVFAKFKLPGDLLRDWKLNGICATVVNSIVIVVSALNSLMSNQISRLNISGIRASVMNIKEERKGLASHDADTDELDEVAVDIDFSQCEEDKLRNGHYHIVFAHPETLISSKYGWELLLSKQYQENLVAIVIDEAHCIVE